MRRDLAAWVDRAAPDGTSWFVHDAEGPDDMPAHVKSAILGTALTLPVRGGRLALGTWQSNIPQKEFDAWVLEVQGIDSKGVPKKTGLFQALKQAGLSPPLSQRPWIEASEWRGGWLYLTVPVGEAMDLFRIRLRPETGVVEGPFERVTAGTGSGLVGGHRMAPNGDMVYARQESSADLFSVEVPSSGKVSGQLRKHTNDSGRINRLVIHASGTVGAWELRGNSAEEKPWFCLLYTSPSPRD